MTSEYDMNFIFKHWKVHLQLLLLWNCLTLSAAVMWTFVKSCKLKHFILLLLSVCVCDLLHIVKPEGIRVTNRLTHCIAVQQEEAVCVPSILHCQVKWMSPIQVCLFLQYGRRTQRYYNTFHVISSLIQPVNKINSASCHPPTTACNSFVNWLHTWEHVRAHESMAAKH